MVKEKPSFKGKGKAISMQSENVIVEGLICFYDVLGCIGESWITDKKKGDKFKHINTGASTLKELDGLKPAAKVIAEGRSENIVPDMKYCQRILKLNSRGFTEEYF
ncbi:hypothetical protein Drorol1_Dr00007647 [Drosera rotundifolia]